MWSWFLRGRAEMLDQARDQVEPQRARHAHERRGEKSDDFLHGGDFSTAGISAGRALHARVGIER